MRLYNKSAEWETHPLLPENYLHRYPEIYLIFRLKKASFFLFRALPLTLNKSFLCLDYCNSPLFYAIGLATSSFFFPIWERSARISTGNKHWFCRWTSCRVLGSSKKLVSVATFFVFFNCFLRVNVQLQKFNYAVSNQDLSAILILSFWYSITLK